MRSYALNQKMCIAGGCAPAFPVYRKGVDKKIDIKMEKTNKVLPPVSTTDLKACIDSGVPLQDVSTIMIHDNARNIRMEIEDFEQTNNEE